MSRNDSRFLFAAAVIGGVAVAAGAFGAHALEGRVPVERIGTFETGARYAMYHALALAAVALLRGRAGASRTWLTRAGRLFIAGTVIFSGSLFALVLLDLPWLGAITPLGGVCFLAGWAALAVAAWRHENAPGSTRPPGA